MLSLIWGGKENASMIYVWELNGNGRTMSAGPESKNTSQTLLIIEINLNFEYYATHYKVVFVFI